jgi:hypothetical protein
MPRFYFHVSDTHGTVLDPEGIELPDDDTARKMGQVNAHNLGEWELQAGRKLDNRRVEVVGPDGKAVGVYLLEHFVN